MKNVANVRGVFVTVRVVNIGSGSSGNALLIHAAEASLLVDCGIGPRTIEATLRAHGLDWTKLGGMVVSHEHSDHIKALPAALRKGVPITCTPGTAMAAGIPVHAYVPIDRAGASFVDGVTVRPLTLSHDAAEPCGFEITVGETRIVVITDTGEALDHFTEPIRNADLLILEANHDERMLWNGPYPHYLKQRVASVYGHLSNGAAGELLREALKASETLPEIWLGHLSETNNRPDRAIATVRQELGPLADSARIVAMSRRGGERWASGRTPSRQLRLLEPG